MYHDQDFVTRCKYTLDIPHILVKNRNSLHSPYLIHYIVAVSRLFFREIIMRHSGIIILFLLITLILIGCEKRKVWEQQVIESDGVTVEYDFQTEIIDEDVFFYITIKPPFEKIPEREFSMSLELFETDYFQWIDFPYEEDNEKISITLSKPLEEVDEKVKVKWQNRYTDYAISFSGVIWRR